MATPNDSIREERPKTFAADQGTSLTSHGDGTPSIDPELVRIRDEGIKAEKARDKKLRDDAAALLKSSAPSASATKK